MTEAVHCPCQADPVAVVQALTEDELMTVLRDPKNALCKQYKTMFKMDSAELRVTTGALRAIAREAVSRGTGARGLRSIMERLLRDAQFEVGHGALAACCLGYSSQWSKLKGYLLYNNTAIQESS